jgi:hypothetical protein
MNICVESSLRVTGNKVLKEICGPKKDEMNGQFMILYKEDFHGL